MVTGELSSYRVSRLLDGGGSVVCEVWLPEDPTDADVDLVNEVLDLFRDPELRT